MRTKPHATPYNLDATGFYFEVFDDYQAKSKSLFDSYGNLVGEFEIQFIDGENVALFETCGVDQSNLNTWFNDIEFLQDYEKISLYYLVSFAG